MADVSVELKTVESLGRFIGRYGLSTFLVLVFIWWMYQERQAGYASTSLQIKDLNGQLLHVSGLLVEHHEAEKRNSAEITRVLIAQCVNQATSTEQRERCLGWR